MKYICAIIILLVSFGFSKLQKEKGISNKQDNKYTIYDFSLTDIENKSFEFKKLKGNVVLIVNVASKCGFTNQYVELQQLYQKYNNQMFEIIAVPSNNFGNQEPGTNEEIQTFCKQNFNISFPIMAKTNVKGENINNLYKFLTDKSIHPKTGGAITWNFNKFLIDKNGIVVERFSSLTKPMSKKIERKINNLLQTGE